MKFYYPEELTYKDHFRKLIKPLKTILYVSIPIGSIYGFLKLFEDRKRLGIFINNKIVIAIFLILFSIPILIFVISSFYYLFKIAFLLIKDISIRAKSYKKLYFAWSSESYKNNEIYIPVLKIPIYGYFLQESKHESKILKYVHFDIENIGNIPSYENWNIKLALGEYKDVFYVIYHILINDKKKLINVAIENRDLGDERQLKSVTRFTEDNLSFVELCSSESEEKEYKVLKYFINDDEVKVADRKEKIELKNLHNLRLEVWSSNAIHGEKVFINAEIKNICISWE